MSTPRGVVTLLGPDGSGKSTLADEIEASLTAGGTSVLRIHHRPAVMFRPRSSSVAHITEPHQQVPRGLVASALKLIAIYADYVVGWVTRVRPAAKRGVCLIERGWFDMAVDPRRYRFPTTLRPLVLALGRLLPRSDLALILTGDPEAFHARKREIELNEVRRQLSEWRALMKPVARRVLEVDTVESSARQAAAQTVAALGDLPARSWRSVPAAKRLSLCATGEGAALDALAPLTRRADVAARLGRMAYKLGVLPPADAPLPVADLLRDLDIEAGGIAAFKSSAAGRWVVGVSTFGSLCYVLKIGSSDDAGLRNEAHILAAMRANASIRVPDVVWAGQWRDHFVVCSRAVEGRSGRTISFAEAGDIAASLSREGSDDAVVHGDFAPWNVLGTDAGWVVIDWESARRDWSPLFDLTHFVVRSGALLGRLTPQAGAGLLAEPGDVGARYLDAVGVDPSLARSLIHEYLSATESEHRGMRESRFRRELSDALVQR